ncbi:MAG: AAA family ATPase [Kiloniellales bacterium]|nr:AAA family ATPase [Kiloniellales bacterium]
MYEEFFGIKENPFSITPDPRYLYMSKGHQEALAHLLYGIRENGGFVMLTGEVGTGKTSVCRCLLEQLPNAADVALVLNPKLNELEFVASICDELGIDYPRETTSLKVLIDRLNHHLLDIHARGRHVVVIIDEAQNLGPQVLEQVRLLTNLETSKKKLLQMILIGQPELNELLGRFEMRQLAQRVTARYHLEPLSRADVKAYIDHRLSVGGLPPTLFSNWAREAIYRRSGGIPRLINSLCDRCLIACYAKNRWVVDGTTVREAANEVFGRGPRWRRAVPWAAAAAALAALIVSVPLGLGYVRWDPVGGLLAGLSAPHEEDEPAPIFSMVKLPPDAPRPEVTLMPAAVPPLAEPVDEAAGPRIGPSTSPAADDGEVSLYQVFDPLSFANDPETAMAGLFQLWGLDYATVDRSVPCAAWSSNGVQCYKGRDSWNVLVGLDRPAVITLQDSERNQAHALLVASGEGRIVLQFGDQRVATSRAALEPLWTGQYLVLWRAPEWYRRVLSSGLEGRDVAWLYNRLSRVDGMPKVEVVRTRFDAELRARVMHFQKSRGLEPDGIVGPQTIIHLDNFVPETRVQGEPDSAS